MDSADQPDIPPPSSDRPIGAASGSRGSSTGDEPTRIIGEASVSAPGEGSSSAPGSGGAIPLGPRIEGYALKEEIHRGGQGIVYRAVQVGTKRLVALKVLLEGPLASDSVRQRFDREIELAASLRHPNIVTILDSGVSDGRCYFAMEYIEGLRFDRYLAQKRPPLPETLELMERVCLAVNFAHQRGVIHRDLKPPNILVDAEGQPHVLDFGLAKPVHRKASDDSTIRVLSTAGQLLGTVAYMSPEQAAGMQDVDVRSDVYSLGVVFYDALVGHPPYDVDGPLGEVLQRIANADPTNPRSLISPATNIRIDDELATILLKCLEKEPARRYQTAGELARDLRNRLEGRPIEAKRASTLYMLKKTLRRYRLQAGMAALLLAMLVGFLITFAVLFSRERDARQRADENNEIARQAVIRQKAALGEARQRTAEAIQAQLGLRQALGREHIQRGDLALQRSDAAEARDSYWNALEVAPGPAAAWALRQYCLRTADSGGELLALQQCGPVALSSNGELAAACTSPRGVWVRNLKTDAVVRWLRTPGEITHLQLNDDGSAAAAGAGWARTWDPEHEAPVVSLQLADAAQPQAIWAAESGRALVLAGQRIVRVVRGEVGENSMIVHLTGSPTGQPDFCSQHDEIAVPTTAGVELARVCDDRIELSLAWSQPTVTPQAVRFAPDGQTLAVVADALYVWHRDPSDDGDERRWEKLATETAGWDMCDLEPRLGAAVLGNSAGRLASVREHEPAELWDFIVPGLTAVRLLAGEHQVLTLDGRGTLSRWLQRERVEQRRFILPMPAATWAAAADGSTVLLSLPRGRVVAYQYGQPEIPRTIIPPRMFGGLPGVPEEGDLSLAIDDRGRRAFVRDGVSLRFIELNDRSARSLVWSDQRLPVAGKSVLSGNGDLAALLVSSPLGDQQRIIFFPWPLADARATAELTTSPVTPEDPARSARHLADPRSRAPIRPRPLPPIDFVGAVIRDLEFIPRTRSLLVARSSGQILFIDPDVPEPPTTARSEPALSPTQPVFAHLDSPPLSLAISRSGEYLAVACEDRVVRLLSVVLPEADSGIAPHGEVRHRVPLDSAGPASPAGIGDGRLGPELAFNPRDDVLMVRTTDGTVRLYDAATGEQITRWALPINGGRPLAVWVGEADAMLLGFDNGVAEYRYDFADQLVERGRSFARQRQIARRLDDGDLDGAWRLAGELGEASAPMGVAMRRNLLECLLRQDSLEPPTAWIAAVERDSLDPAGYLQLGHAAYEGEHFEQSARWLRAARESNGDDLDASTLKRLADCDYLLGKYSEAADELAAVLRRPDLDLVIAPTVALERVAALMMADRREEARQAAQRIGEVDPWGRFGDAVAVAAARITVRLLTGLEDVSLTTIGLDELLTRSERGLLYRDDVPFFSGEMARLRGDTEAAAVQYQRCIDLSRDTWPANWARYRLAELRMDADKP